MPDDTRNFIDPKYAHRYRGSSDWVGAMISEHCTRKEDGAIDLETLFKFAERNGIDTAKYRKQTKAPNAPGRLRMTIGNMLRARALRRHGLKGPNGRKLEPPKEFLQKAPKEPEEDLNGNSLVVADKPKKAAKTKKARKRKAA